MNRAQFTSILNGALAMHEPSLKELLATFDEKSAPSVDLQHKRREQALASDGGGNAGHDEDFPTVNDLIVSEGVAVVPIHGIMLKRSRLLQGWSSSQLIVGTDAWSEMIYELTKRNDIDAIVLDFDTGGGQVDGTQLLANSIWKARKAGKLTIGVVNEFCASAGLWAVSQCEHIVITGTGSIGSLGVYTLHEDDTKMLSQMGIEKSVIYRGKYKAVQERPLDTEAAADMQRWIDACYSQFVDAVARGRGVDAETVLSRWGESQLFRGIEAVSNGLADEIGTLQDVLDSLQAGHSGRVSIDVLPADTDPETDPDGESNAMIKLNATGQVLDASGKAVGNLSELQVDAAAITKYFAAQTGELIESAVKTAKEAAAETLKAELASASKDSHARLDELVAAVGAEKGVAAFKAGHTVEAAKAGLADDLAATVKAQADEIAKLKAGTGKASTPAPKFNATDAGADGKPAGGNAGNPADPDAEFAAAYESEGSGFASLKHFAAFKRYQAEKSA